MNYSISDLEQLSGVQSHTIRIWEQRYNALKPTRTDGNTRLYDDIQLVRLLNIVSLNQSGLKISKICSLSDQDVDLLLEKEIQPASNPTKYDYYVTQLIKFGLAYDETSFETLLSSCIGKSGILETYKNIIYPILVRLGLMWRKDNICPAQEHFLSNIIRRKIYTAIDFLTLKQTTATKTWMLFLPEDEEHDVGLLFAQYILKASGHKVIYLGAKVPLDSVKRVIDDVKIDNVLFFMVKLRPLKTAQTYIDNLQEICGKIDIHLAGNMQTINQITTSSNIKKFNSLEEFENNIKDTSK
ncbi:MerR family transcriptional regulator [Pedobacter jejuensis]|uniref:MerR family transcriptional regulator n=1 Tax=Pedobacter jejuensis TaxID=1268550 RepID=A0A3N0BTJ7_9SPHI|nr:MerR family transcriptional regulator [Pedobacter jejuensis]RNL52416.1 MerR family transcriptional regulator [Pedobacter jejuensis]